MLSEYMQQNDANAFVCTLILNQKLDSLFNLSSLYQLNLKLSFFFLLGEQVVLNVLLRSRSKQPDYDI